MTLCFVNDTSLLNEEAKGVFLTLTNLKYLVSTLGMYCGEREFMESILVLQSRGT